MRSRSLRSRMIAIVVGIGSGSSLVAGANQSWMEAAVRCTPDRHLRSASARTGHPPHAGADFGATVRR